MIWLLGGYMWLFVHRPFEVWPVLGDLQIERAYMIVMFLAWLMAPGKVWSLNRNHLALAFFAAVIAVSWLASPYMSQPICADTFENYFKVLVFYVMVVTTVRDERKLRLLLGLYLGAVSLYMAHSLLEYARGRYEWRMGISRMIGVDTSFGDPNSFASGLLYTLPLALPFWSRASSLRRMLLLGYAGGVVVCLVLTGSRAGFLGLCLCCGLMMLARARRKSLVVLAGGFGGVAALAVAVCVMPAELQNRYLTIIDSSVGPKNAAESAHGRIDGLVRGYEAWQKSPLLGHGPRSFELATGSTIGAHNIYGQVISELGATGVVALLGLVGCMALNYREVRRAYRDDPGLRQDFLFQVSQGMGIILILLLLLGCAGHSLFRYNWQWFAAFQAVTVQCVRERNRGAAYYGRYLAPLAA